MTVHKMTSMNTLDRFFRIVGGKELQSVYGCQYKVIFIVHKSASERNWENRFSGTIKVPEKGLFFS
jgi:hypothetical protein